jgi:hypothetical protein
MFPELAISLRCELPWPARSPDLSALWLSLLRVPQSESVHHLTTDHRWPADRNSEANFRDIRKHGETSSGKPESEAGRVWTQWWTPSQWCAVQNKINRDVIKCMWNKISFNVRSFCNKNNKKITPWLLVRKRTIPTERPPLVGQVSANFCWHRVSRVQSNGSPRR